MLSQKYKIHLNFVDNMLMEVLMNVPVSGHGIPHQEEVLTVGRQSLLAYLEQLSRNCKRSSIK